MERKLLLAWHTTESMVDGIFSHLPNLIIGIIVYYIFVELAAHLRKIIIHIGEHAKLDITLAHALGTLSSAGLTVLGILITAVIVVPGFKPTHVITALGVTSIAVGFAFKDILENFFAGLLLLWQKPFRLGDIIKTGIFEGAVEELRIRSTHLRTEVGELVIVPNRDIYSQAVVVKTAYKHRRSAVTIAGNPNRTVEANRKIIRQIIDSTETIAKSPPPAVLLIDIGPAGQIFKVQFWTASEQATIAQTIDQVNSRIRDAMYEPVQHS